ncbi:sec-independent protein translocase protein TatB [Pasteurella testudinis DSM 23072]|uniref:Sec-independent protein translocase protein TatB n=1 Tax=Pasteurella testudinis DSM 23072 TaxID=1122938 RepID=A0A1W1UR17_9PAST|nr:Sec-independent protein translocase protein TatB [Pasteurella testudinis]SMB83552.1 sec-independent protein translocase protein TatB [Pasteurella testudinis DSM 23072]SUB51050.1 Sec-independent protein translocase protein TatB [Pasteurella testudinis]
MFDIGFSELVLIFVVGLVVLGPQRLPVAIRTVVGWIRTIRGIANNVQNELSQELKLHELQESIKKAEKLNLSELSPELAKNIQDLKESAQKIQQDVQQQESKLNKELKDGVKSIEDTLSADERAALAEDGEPHLLPEDAENMLALADKPETPQPEKRAEQTAKSDKAPA